jgi:hypothetical protein
MAAVRFGEELEASDILFDNMNVMTRQHEEEVLPPGPQTDHEFVSSMLPRKYHWSLLSPVSNANREATSTWCACCAHTYRCIP